MTTGTLTDIIGEKPKCTGCREREASIQMTGYAENHARILLCQFCGLQLARKLLEDLCELVTGDRHG